MSLPHQLGERDVLLDDLSDHGLDLLRGIHTEELRAALLDPDQVGDAVIIDGHHRIQGRTAPE